MSLDEPEWKDHGHDQADKPAAQNSGRQIDEYGIETSPITNISAGQWTAIGLAVFFGVIVILEFIEDYNKKTEMSHLISAAKRARSTPSQPEAPPAQFSQPVQPAEATVSARILHAAFARNEVAAMLEYGGRPLSVSGIVTEISVDPNTGLSGYDDIMGGYHVKLASGTMFPVDCWIRRSHVQIAAQLRRGDEITVTGRIHDFAIDLYLVIEDCTIALEVTRAHQ